MRKKLSVEERMNELVYTGLFERVIDYSSWLKLEWNGGVVFIFIRDQGSIVSSRDEDDTIEKILDRLPEDIQTKLLFHLDLLT